MQPGLPGESAELLEAVDGDTIRVRLSEQELPVRYIGVDAPERDQPLDDEASRANAGLVLGQSLLLVKDSSESDPFGRLLRYVFVGGVFVNETLVRTGWARPASYPPDTACDALFAAAQIWAQEYRLGGWDLDWAGQILPGRVLSAPETPVPAVGNCHPAYPTICLPPPPPDLDCRDIPHRRFKVLAPDPHNFDGDKNGIGCEG